MRLLAQRLYPDTHPSELAPRSCLTSGVDTAPLTSSDIQTAYLSVNIFLGVLLNDPVAPEVRLAEYFIAENSRPPSLNNIDYPLRVDGLTIYEPQSDHRIIIHTERFMNYNNKISDKRKELELRRFIWNQNSK